MDVTHYSPHDREGSFASADLLDSSTSFKVSRSFISSGYAKFLDAFQPYELDASNSSESADLLF